MANRIPLIVDIIDDNKIKELPVGDNLDLGGAGVTNAGVINATDIRINNVSFNNPFSGDYNDLTNKPVIPEVPSALSAFANDVGYLSAFPAMVGSYPRFGSVCWRSRGVGHGLYRHEQGIR